MPSDDAGLFPVVGWEAAALPADHTFSDASFVCRCPRGTKRFGRPPQNQRLSASCDGERYRTIGHPDSSQKVHD